jgi:hypothetical protein
MNVGIADARPKRFQRDEALLEDRIFRYFFRMKLPVKPAREPKPFKLIETTRTRSEREAVEGMMRFV